MACVCIAESMPQRPGGVPVLCLPGLTRNSRDFVELAQHLCAEHEVLTADLRGRGRSAWDPDASHYQVPTYVQISGRCWRLARRAACSSSAPRSGRSWAW